MAVEKQQCKQRDGDAGLKSRKCRLRSLTNFIESGINKKVECKFWPAIKSDSLHQRFSRKIRRKPNKIRLFRPLVILTTHYGNLQCTMPALHIAINGIDNGFGKNASGQRVKQSIMVRQ